MEDRGFHSVNHWLSVACENLLPRRRWLLCCFLGVGMRPHFPGSTEGTYHCHDSRGASVVGLPTHHVMGHLGAQARGGETRIRAGAVREGRGEGLEKARNATGSQVNTSGPRIYFAADFFQ